jgi:CRP-like cAMP-binding protein
LIGKAVPNGRTLPALPADPADGYLSGNLLLDTLPFADRSDLQADLQIVLLAAHDQTHLVGSVVRYVDFPINAVLSVVAILENGDTIEVGTVGRESFVETDAALNSARSQRSSFCQVRGTVGRMSLERFESRMTGSRHFAQAMRRNVRAALFSAQQFAACNSKHSIEQRCARWLSMTQDRVGAADFTLTHEFLAIMLGVRRSGVSQAADALQKLGAIVYRRGHIRIVDPELLNATACECYAACKNAFAVSFAE